MRMTDTAGLSHTAASGYSRAHLHGFRSLNWHRIRLNHRIGLSRLPNDLNSLSAILKPHDSPSCGIVLFPRVNPPTRNAIPNDIHMATQSISDLLTSLLGLPQPPQPLNILHGQDLDRQRGQTPLYAFRCAHLSNN